MKATSWVVILSILISHSAIANGYYDLKGERYSSYNPPSYKKVCSQEVSCNESYQNNCGRSVGCGGYSSVNCSCADPGCFYGNPCLSAGKCCESFGNIGGSDFDPICPCGNG